MRRARLLAVALLLASACGPDASPPTEPAPPEPETPAPAPPPPPAPEPPAAPEGDLRGDATEGAVLYGLYCATCHGAEGRGDGAAAAGLDPKPADHTDPAYMGQLSDAYLYTVISKGGIGVGKSPLMAPWGSVINDQGIRDLIAHVRTLSEP